MNSGRTIFSQIIDHLPIHEFRKCVARYQGDHRVRSFSCWDQFLCMSFAQLTYRESLRDIVACLRSLSSRLYHMGIRGNISRSTLADANENRDWRIYAQFAQALIRQARCLYASEPLNFDLKGTVYALDSTIVDLCISLFPWARYKSDQHALKMHTLLDLRGNIPVFIRITPAQLHDVNILDHLTPQPGAFYVMDRGYLDFARLYRLTQAAAFWVTRPRKKFRFRRIHSHPVQHGAGVLCDQTISLVWFYTAKGHPAPLRRIRYYDPEQNRRLTFITNNFTLPARTIADLYKSRWQVELFFKWIKQHLRIKAFYGTSPNAVKTQIWIAVCVYVLIAILRKRLGVASDPHTMLQILSVSLMEKTPIFQASSESTAQIGGVEVHNQLSLFDF